MSSLSAMDGDIALALISHLLKRGVLDQADVEQIADSLDEQGNEDAGHLVRCAWLEADETPPTDQRRAAVKARLRIVSGNPDGGNGSD